MMWQIAINMLFNDKAKYYTLISVLTFSSLLITEQMAIFTGVINWMVSPILNTNVPIWVMDQSVEQVNFAKSMPDIDLERVRSVSGVKWASPLLHNLLDVRIHNGRYTSVQIVGIDSTTLYGLPPHMVKGKVEDLRQDNSVIIDQTGLEKLNQNLKKPLDIGDVFEINDHELKIVGIAKILPSFEGSPLIYTTYQRALSLDPSKMHNLSYILVEPVEGTDIIKLLNRIHAETGLLAQSDKQFYWSTILWFMRNDGIPIGITITTLLVFIIGLAITAQTFFSFVKENIGNFGALKAMGANNRLLSQMVLVQTGLAGFIGYGIGMMFTALGGIWILHLGLVPFDLPLGLLLVTFLFIMGICLLSAYLGIQQIIKLDAAEVFRG